MSGRLRSDLILLLVAIIWGSAFVAQRIAALAGSVFLFNGLRFWLACIVLLPWTGLRWKFGWSEWRLVGLAGFVLFTASALQQAGIQFTTAGNAGFLTSLYVVLVPILLWVTWRETPHPALWMAVTLAAVGAFLLSTTGRFSFKSGDLLEVAGALFWACHVVILGRFAPRVDPLRFSSGQFLVAGLLNLICGGLFEKGVSILQWNVIGSIVYTGIFSVGIGYTLQVIGQRQTPPSDAALILSLEAVVAVISSWLLLGEKLLPIQILGCLLIFFAVLLAQAKELLPSRKLASG